MQTVCWARESNAVLDIKSIFYSPTLLEIRHDLPATSFSIEETKLYDPHQRILNSDDAGITKWTVYQLTAFKANAVPRNLSSSSQRDPVTLDLSSSVLQSVIVEAEDALATQFGQLQGHQAASQVLVGVDGKNPEILQFDCSKSTLEEIEFIILYSILMNL